MCLRNNGFYGGVVVCVSEIMGLWWCSGVCLRNNGFYGDVVVCVSEIMVFMVVLWCVSQK